MGYDRLFSHSCMSQQFYPNGLLEESKWMCLLCLKIFIQSENNMYSSVKGNTHNLFSLTVWLKTFPQNYMSLVFTLYFACSYSLAYLKKHCQLKVQNTNKPSCMLLWRCSPQQPAYCLKDWNICRCLESSALSSCPAVSYRWHFP